MCLLHARSTAVPRDCAASPTGLKSVVRIVWKVTEWIAAALGASIATLAAVELATGNLEAGLGAGFIAGVLVFAGRGILGQLEDFSRHWDD